MAKKTIRYRPSRGQAAAGFCVCAVFVGIGAVLVIPLTAGTGFFPVFLFGLAWTGIALFNMVNYARYLFGKKEEDKELFGGYEVIEEPETRPAASAATSSALSPEKRLEQLETLRRAGLIDDGEYRSKRKEILDSL